MKNTLFRAVKYLKYKKAKSIILILLFTIMSTLIIFSLSLDSTIQNYYNNLDNKNGIGVVASPNLDKVSQEDMMKGNFGLKEATDEQLEQIRKLSYVSDVVKTDTKVVKSKKLAKLKDPKANGKQDFMIAPSPDGTDMKGLRLTGANNLAAEASFKSKMIDLTAGALPSKDNEVVLSERLAQTNKLKLNDTFTLSDNTSKKEITFKVVGLYKFNKKIDDLTASMVPENTMYSNLSTLDQFSNAKENNTSFIDYYISDAKDYGQFKKDYYKIMNTTSDKVDLELDDMVYHETVKPLEQVSGVIQKITIVIITISSLIVATISFVMIKERNYEIGVLYSLSESKRHIIIQFLIENLILVTIGFVFALVINFAFCSTIINSLMGMEILSGVRNGAMMMAGNVNQEAGAIQASFSILNLVKSYIYIMGVIIVVTVLSIIQTLLKRPKEIINS